MNAIPFMVVGDGPQESTGLGRIARDLGMLLATEITGVDLVQVGGAVPPCWTAWPHVPMGIAERSDDWGAKFVEALWRDRWGRMPGILFLIWDPARCYAYTQIDVPVQRWAYTAVDSHNRSGGLSGPPGAAVANFDRVLAYGRWASTILKTCREDAVPYLPHGFWPSTFFDVTPDEQTWVTAQLGPFVGQQDVLIGCVAANQARKDLALFCETLTVLRARGLKVHGWLHTDVLVNGWSIQQLVEDYALEKTLSVTLGTYSDRQLASLYQRCDVTIAPGLGEGFGYPIVESLASGVPVVHGDFGGGRELVPKVEWRFPVREIRRESIYALTRPVFRADDVANAVSRVLTWKHEVGPEIARAYCRGSVAHLEWEALRPRWTSWIRQGLS